jgi:hypothetical protein
MNKNGLYSDTDVNYTVYIKEDNRQIYQYSCYKQYLIIKAIWNESI